MDKYNIFGNWYGWGEGNFSFKIMVLFYVLTLGKPQINIVLLLMAGPLRGGGGKEPGH